MTAVDVVWRPQAREDLFDLYVHIARDNPTQRNGFTRGSSGRWLSLPLTLRLGTSRPDIRPSTRILVEGSYLILYEIHSGVDPDPIETIEIVRVVHGRRDLRGLR